MQHLNETIYSTLGVLLLTTIAWFIYYVKTQQQYWQKLGIQTPPVTFFFGNYEYFALQTDSLAEKFLKIYNNIKSKALKHGGIYILTLPIYIPVDLDIIKHILITDFQHFIDRGVYINEKDDPLSAHLFALEGKKWKILRSKLSPTFTTGKLKMMLEGVSECGANLKKVMDASLDKTIEIKDISARYTTDVIGKTAFGIECDSLTNPNNKFREMGKKFFEKNFWQNLKAVAVFAMPDLMKKFRAVLNDKHSTEFFFNTVKNTVDYREKNNIIGKDFIDLLIQLKNKGRLLDDESANKENATDNDNKINFEELVAQAFVFFEAGFETSSTTMTWALYELSRNQDIQEKARKEIQDVVNNYDGQVTYEAMQEMKYLDRIIQETLRKYPALSMLNRVVTKEYKVPGTNLVLEKGLKINISVIGIHRDEKYYPDPEKFDPERFNEQNKHNRPSCAWIPFGEGPRNCIGMRFGLMETKVGLITMLNNYRFRVNEKTQEPIKFDPKNFMLSPLGGMWLDYEAV